MGAIPQLSAAQCMKRSTAMCELLKAVLTNCEYGGVAGYWPINGMGPFNDTATPLNCYPDPTSGGNPSCMNDAWPYVYRTLTVVWTHTTGALAGAQQTVVYQYQDYCDTPVLVTTTTTGDYWDPPNSWTGSPDVTPAFIQQGYTYPPGRVLGDVGGNGIFTATLSNQFSVSDYLAAAANANALVTANLSSLPTPSLSYQTLSYYPTSTGTQSANLDAGYVCAAALGMPTRDPSWPPAFGFHSVDPALPAIYDFDTPPSSVPAINFGGVICLASKWVLTGIAPLVIYSPATDHTIILAQEFSLAGPASTLMPEGGSMSAILQLWPTFGTTASGLNHPNPLTLLPITITFVPADVLANLAAGNDTTAQYGILGFNCFYTGAGPISLGAFQATGGAGGTGPQPGAGGGAPPA